MKLPVPVALAESWWNELERLSRVLGRVGPDEVCCEGLTQRQCAILRTLARLEGMRLSDLATQAGVSLSAMSRILDKLAERGLVERVWGVASDGRAASVAITAAGRRTRRQLDRLMLERSAQLAASLPRPRRAAVLEALQILNKALEGQSCCGLNEPVALLPKVEEEE